VKGFFTQGLVILLRAPIGLEELRPLLAQFDVGKELPPSENWEMSGPGLVISYRPEVHGSVTLDVVGHPWPDDMGDAKATPMRFAAWSMGHFGPFTFPGGLERSLQQSWSWKEASDVVRAHGAFLRLKMTYLGGAQPEAPIVPKDYRPLAELEFLTRLAIPLLKVPGALCWFDPGGEVILPPSLVEERWAFAQEQGIPPVDLWTNVRMFSLDASWMLMDTVGNRQLDVPDLEAVFPRQAAEPSAVASFLLNATAYVATSGATIADGDTMDGPGNERWRGHHVKKAFLTPPREVIRWFPPGARAHAPAGVRIS